MRCALPADTSAVPRSRALVREAAAEWDADRLEDAELIASELVSNAVRHGAGPVELRIDVVGQALRITVLDRGPGLAGPIPQASATGDGGRGLLLVGRLAESWGWSQSDGVTSFWAEVASSK